MYKFLERIQIMLRIFYYLKNVLTMDPKEKKQEEKYKSQRSEALENLDKGDKFESIKVEKTSWIMEIRSHYESYIFKKNVHI